MLQKGPIEACARIMVWINEQDVVALGWIARSKNKINLIQFPENRGMSIMRLDFNRSCLGVLGWTWDGLMITVQHEGDINPAEICSVKFERLALCDLRTLSIFKGYDCSHEGREETKHAFRPYIETPKKSAILFLIDFNLISSTYCIYNCPYGIQ